jgi:integrase
MIDNKGGLRGGNGGRLLRGDPVVKKTVPIETTGEINALLSALKERNPNYYIFALTAINWGLRCSDILALTIGSVIAGTGKRIQIKDEITVVEQKTGHERHIEIQDKMKDALYEHIKEREKREGGLNLSAPLVLSQKKDKDRKQKAPSRQHASSVVNTAAKEAGIRGSIGSHGLRKTFVYQAWKRGIGVDVLQKILGHSSVVTTHRYACIPQAHELEAYRKINFGLRPATRRSRKRSGFHG